MFSAMYRIYSRISREILDVFSPIFIQFDLYAGHQNCLQKSFFINSMMFIGCVICFKSIKIKSNFGHFLAIIFSIRLIRGSTYTRVYTVSQIFLLIKFGDPFLTILTISLRTTDLGAFKNLHYYGCLKPKNGWETVVKRIQSIFFQTIIVQRKF